MSEKNKKENGRCKRGLKNFKPQISERNLEWKRMTCERKKKKKDWQIKLLTKKKKSDAKTDNKGNLTEFQQGKAAADAKEETFDACWARFA